MQPGPEELSPESVSYLHNPSPATINTQHGSGSTAATCPQNPVEHGQVRQPSLLDSLVASSPRESSPPWTDSERRLSEKNAPSSPAGIRIIEYEQASMSVREGEEGHNSKGSGVRRSPDDKRSPVQELPNEVMIHALAYLTPNDLTSVSLVSKRFHALVTGPHAWRNAFARFFPGAQSLLTIHESEGPGSQVVRSDRRAFTRLSALASWRSEYILRTRLLRSLYRGKPLQSLSNASHHRSTPTSAGAPTVAYNSSLYTTINHIHASFGDTLNKRSPRFIHGADESGGATSSDPTLSKTDNWGLSDPQSFLSYADRFPGDAEYGLGPGEIVGAPNVMDVSQPFGMVCGEGSPGGMVYLRATDEMRGRFLFFSSAMSMPDIGIPKVLSTNEAITAVWIAKSSAIPDLTDGLVGILSGSSSGVINAHSLGPANTQLAPGQRYARGELTARWVLSPGVPIVAVAVDNEYTPGRYTQNRIWAVALNALGELFYLTKFPKRANVDKRTPSDEESVERHAWLTGRTTYWSLVESSRRVAREDPYAVSPSDGSYSPRTSWNGMCLSSQQIRAETLEIESFVTRKPKDFQKSCLGWDMRRKLEVDFAGDDGHNAGENLVVLECGHEDASLSKITRYSRRRVQHDVKSANQDVSTHHDATFEGSGSASVFGSAPRSPPDPERFSDQTRLENSLALADLRIHSTPRPSAEEWCKSRLALGGLKNLQISTSTLDNSHLATITASEDPLLTFSGRSHSSSPFHTPASPLSTPIEHASDLPGQRARFLAVGTLSGVVLIWDVRVSVPQTSDITTSIEPIRVIHTESPEISSLALTSLYVVHGGNDGLVQAWDPLASTMQPIRTLNSKFISRARRRLFQAQASPQGVGINLFAAGAICLDPDPTVLRGMVSLGLQLLYWSFSSSAADQYKSQKRRLRRAERGSNNGGEQFSGAPRGGLKSYIASERYELDREKRERQKAAERFAGRFGTEMLDGSEEEMLAYAALLSQESLQEEQQRRTSDTSTIVSSVAPTPICSPSLASTMPKSDDELEADMAEAIRQSLASTPSRSDWDIPFRPMKNKGRKGSSTKTSPRFSPALAGSSKVVEMDDLSYALQLSLAEEESRLESEKDDFPVLRSPRSGSNAGKRNGNGKSPVI